MLKYICWQKYIIIGSDISLPNLTDALASSLWGSVFMANENQIQQVNFLLKKIGLGFIDLGMYYLQKSFHLSPLKVGNDFVNQAIKQYNPTQPIVHFDSHYYLISIEQWQEIIKADWIDTRKWLLDKRDCDNLANAFASNASMYYEINSAGRVYGKLFDINGKFINWHYWNVVILPDKRVYFIEPMNDGVVEYKGGIVVIKNGKYEPHSYVFG